MATQHRLAVGSHVWVEDADVAWIDGEVLEVSGDDITVCCTTGKTVSVKVFNAYPKDVDAPSSGVDDMTKLAYLHEPGVLHNLKCRYFVDEIYTYTGSILIAVNPFRRLPHLYASEVMEKYKGVALGVLPPHPFAVADAAYRQMRNEGISQSILVSGESGAGKTESTKMLMHYLAFMGGRAEAEGGRSVEQQVLESNPVLEAFGNAKTVRNNNSSRFGKFVELQFDDKGRISGAAIRTYLLERSRVCQVSDPERNYHCFYMLCAAPPEDVSKYKLGDPRTFHYLNQSNCYELAAVDDSKEYLDTRRAMDIVGIMSDEQDAIFRVVAAILHLGNVEFTEGEEPDSSQPKDEKSLFHLNTAADLFMCDAKALEDSLCKRVIVTRDENITKSLDPAAAMLSRDALAKIVYSRLFDWLVNKINNSIGQDPDSRSLIGVLDIYGFESFKTNSFEQFCINLTNEKLQQHFNQHVFKMEQEEYRKEEIDWSYIDFVDNQDILDLIEKKPCGIIALLDECCVLPRSTYEIFAQKLYQTFKDHKRFNKPKLSRTDFTICHYAGDVTYQTEHFLDKNKDYVIAEHQALLSASKCTFVSSLFPLLSEDSSKSTKFSSIGSRFRQQLLTLLEALNATEPHYIRCIKPNNLLKPAIFENNNVLQQLRCGGVMEAIRISCAGFPTRRTFDEFLKRFSILQSNAVNGSFDGATAAKRLLKKVSLEGYQIGKTKIFLRAGQMAELDARRTEVLGRSSSIIQRRVRTYLTRKSFILLQNTAVRIQTICRGHLARERYEIMLKQAAAVRIQRHVRMHSARKAYNEKKSTIIIIQRGIRGIAARKELNFRQHTRAATIIQSHCRTYLVRLHYLRLKKATVVTQCAWRRRIAKRELQKLKMAAKEVGALSAAKQMLEKQVEELTLSLNLERQMRAISEVGALQAANEKLEKQIEELSFNLELEKQKRVNMEEMKNKENAELLDKFEGMQLQYKDVNSMLMKERGASQEALAKMTKEDGAIKIAKRKLEKQVEELIESLELERQLRVEMEKKKTAENAKLQIALEKMQLQCKETNAVLLKELEDAEVAPKKEVNETSILQAATERLEKPVEDLNLRLVLEKPMTEVKTEENSRLKDAIDQMQLQNEEAKVVLLKEHEATKNDPVEAPSLQNFPVTISDTTLMQKLTAENEKLKTLVSILEKKVDEVEEKLEESSKISEERLQKALEAESRIVEMSNEMRRLREKLSIIQSEDAVLRQQVMLSASSRNISTSLPSGGLSVLSSNLENGHCKSLEAKDTSSKIPVFKNFGKNDSKLRRTIVERLHENYDILINCVVHDIGFSEGKPVAAVTIYKCLLHWKSFEADRTSIFDRLVQIFGSAIEKEESSSHLAYWLSNISTLLFLMQRSLIASGAAVGISRHKPPTPPTSLFGRMAQGFRSSSANLSAVGFDLVKQVEAKYPALLFKEQLVAYLEKIYGIIRDNTKKDLTPLLSQCMKGSEKNRISEAIESADFSAGLINCNPWHCVVEKFNDLLKTLQVNHVPRLIVQKMFTQVFSFINVQLFNSLLQHRDCCSFGHGEYVKSGLDDLELWCGQATVEFIGSSWDELKHIRQAVGFLVIFRKQRISYEEIVTDLCPVLNVHQLHQICEQYRDDKYGTQSVSEDVFSNMKLLMAANSNTYSSNPTLLDDNPCIPFSVEDLSESLHEKDFSSVQPAAQLLDNQAFKFLKD
ncbi:hypothetical protein HPP92_021766 [Vanilla planifolia]|uniref:Uncharacterized protein n=1 Tax=Vanilla planifolia TaxID=51239 RepID=A0A835PTI5_VANPL|nr:hypothetical protein HPP92_021766 [Vanilla planifolia]